MGVVRVGIAQSWMSRESRRGRRLVGVDRDDIDEAVRHGAFDPTCIVVSLLDAGRHNFAMDEPRDGSRLVQRLDDTESLAFVR